MRLVLRTNCGDHPISPLTENFVAASLAGIEGEPLAKLHFAHPARVPSAVRRAHCRRLVDQIIGEHRWAFGTRLGNRLPKESLCLPSLLLLHRIIPSHSIVDFVTGKPRDLQVNAELLSDRQQLSKMIDRNRIGHVRTGQNSWHLRMNSRDGRARSSHFRELPLDTGGIIGQPLHEVDRSIVMSPGNVTLAGGMKDETDLVGSDFHRFHRVRTSLPPASLQTTLHQPRSVGRFR